MLKEIAEYCSVQKMVDDNIGNVVNDVVLTMLFVCDRKYKCIYIYIFTCYFTIDMLLQSISYVHHLQDRSKQQVQPLTLQASVYCTSGTN